MPNQTASNYLYSRYQTSIKLGSFNIIKILNITFVQTN